MKLCTCNNCGEIFEDMNPKEGATEYPDNIGLRFEPLIKLFVDTTKPETGYWGCPTCCTDGFLSDKIDEREIELIKEGIYWVLTDASTGQYGRRLSTYKYEFKEDGKPATIIDLERYTWLEICNCCDGSYYPNMDELFAIYGAQSTWIIAECLFEMGIVKS